MSIFFPKDQHISYLILHSREKKRKKERKKGSNAKAQAIYTIQSLSPNITKII